MEESKEVFERVWKRVMKDSEAESPVVLNEESTSPCLPAERPPEERPAREHAGDDFLPLREGICLGGGSRDAVPFLQKMTRQTLEDGRGYQTLARRAGGTPGRVLMAMSQKKRNQARRLCAACFLITGVKFWPEPRGLQGTDSYLGALRRRFCTEQEQMGAFLTAAEATADPCLQQMFTELAGECWELACKIRELVEQA